MQILDWKTLDANQRRAALARPAQRDAERIVAVARDIIAEVRAGGDAALKGLTQKFDGVRVDSLAVTEREFVTASKALDASQHAAIDTAIDNVRRFHAAQITPPLRIETFPGVICERVSVPIRAVGLYVPAGSAPLPSTAIMLAVPAALAGCAVRIACTAPRRDGSADPAVLVAARKAGVERVFKVGGAQAIAAMAYGTDSIPKCDKLFGPGNAYVTAAKLLAANDADGAAADLPAGVSEVMVIADTGARAEFVAADLLAQAEHSEDAQSLLVTTSTALAAHVVAELRRQIPALSRGAILAASTANIRLLVVESLEQAFDVANAYAPEHLLLEIDNARDWVRRVTAAGAVFLGAWSPESMGDYCSGPNHTLPTYGFAKAYSGLSLEDFQKRITLQELSPAGLRGLGGTAQTLAHLEGLDAHANAVSVRLRALEAESASQGNTAEATVAQAATATGTVAAGTSPECTATRDRADARRSPLTLARPELLTLKPYSHAAWLPTLTRLHANEAPWRQTRDVTRAGLNRYPEPQPKELVELMARVYDVPRENLLATRGSDEAIDLLSRMFLRSGQDAIAQCSPSFGMYQVAARIQGAEVIDVPLDRLRGWQLDPDAFLDACTPQVKLAYLCSPNNPTGNSLDRAALEYVCERLDGRALVVIDEAYIEWSTAPSLVPWLARFPSLAILRTLSKAHALAGARLGALLASPEVIELAKRIIPPYALTQSTVEVALDALSPAALAQSRARLAALIEERDHLRLGLVASPLVRKVWPSDANFLLIECRDADRFMRNSIAGGSIVRDMRGHRALPDCLRISVGTREQNDTLLNSLEAA